jgi:hypothetical protein
MRTNNRCGSISSMRSPASLAYTKFCTVSTIMKRRLSPGQIMLILSTRKWKFPHEKPHHLFHHLRFRSSFTTNVCVRVCVVASFTGPPASAFVPPRPSQPFQTQPSFHSPENRQRTPNTRLIHQAQLPIILPPRPIGTRLSQTRPTQALAPLVLSTWTLLVVPRLHGRYG